MRSAETAAGNAEAEPVSGCHLVYEPCACRTCPATPHVKQIGVDPYRLSRDGDGVGRAS